tara:strand:- start:62 stop:436 length:375 start_codon:yes stop_codon:yes gene_type:complete
MDILPNLLAVYLSSLLFISCCQTVRANENSLDRLHALAEHALDSGNYALSVEYYDDVLSFDVTSKKAWHNRGFALEMLQLYEDAAESFERALKLGVYSQGLNFRGTNLLKYVSCISIFQHYLAS